MKDITKIILITSIAIVFFVSGVFLSYFVIKSTENTKLENKNSDNDVVITENNKKFKSEYESLNDILDDNSDKKYVEISVDDNNLMKYTNTDELKSIFSEKKSAIIYFGFASCPWCRNAVPVLIDACKEKNIDTIYYLDIKDLRDKKVLKDGNIVTEFEGTEDYKILLELFKDDIDVYSGLNDFSIKRIYAPTVYFIKDGTIVKKHVGTVDSQEDAKILLNEEQTLELKNIYLDGINKINLSTQNEFVCDEDRNC